MQAYVGNQWRKVNWADKVGYGENGVGIRVGEGIWATVTAIDPQPLIIADAKHRQGGVDRPDRGARPAAPGRRSPSAADGKQVGDVEAEIRRKEYGAPYAEPTALPAFADAAAKPSARRARRCSTAGRRLLRRAQRPRRQAAGGPERRVPVDRQRPGARLMRRADRKQRPAMDRPLARPASARGGRSPRPRRGARVRRHARDPARSFRGPNGTRRPNPAGYPRSLQIVEVFHIVRRQDRRRCGGSAPSCPTG